MHWSCILRLWLIGQEVFFITHSLAGVYRYFWIVFITPRTHISKWWHRLDLVGLLLIKMFRIIYKRKDKDHILNTQRPIIFLTFWQHYTAYGYGSNHLLATLLTLWLTTVHRLNAASLLTRRLLCYQYSSSLQHPLPSISKSVKVITALSTDSVLDAI